MNKRIVGYVISHSGNKGGPWEGTGAIGVPALRCDDRLVCTDENHLRVFLLPAVRSHHPDARVIRLVRRERHRAEEAAVVEAAMAVPSEVRDEVQYWRALAKLDDACAALRAKRGG
jgi:hypothetical protein